MTIPVQTPAKNAFAFPTPALEKAISAEWEKAQNYNAKSMPLTMLAFTAIDRIQPVQEAVIESLLVYIDTDTLSYRAEGSDELKQEQNEKWGEILNWNGKRFDAIWHTTSGIMPIEQPKALHEAVARYLNTLNHFQLSAFCVLASVFSSLALALAVIERHIDGKTAFALSRLEEEAQARQWGRDEEADARAQKMQEEILHAERFLHLLKAA